MRSEKTKLSVMVVLTGVLLSVLVPAQVKLPEGVPESWWATVQKDIRMEGYEISEAPAGTGAPFISTNKANGFTTSFSGIGIGIVPIQGGKRDWSLGLELVSRAEGSRLKADMTVKENRIEIYRGNITEWYVNDDRGLEQGFTILKPFCRSGKLDVDLKLTGNLRPKFAEDGLAIDFYNNPHVAVLSYSKLIVTDAAGVVLPSKFEPINGGIRISVDDRDAVYPVTIDPLASSPACTFQGDQTGSMFGWSVSTAGDVNGDGYSDVLVSAPVWTQGLDANGMVYLYLGSASGPSTTPEWRKMGGSNAALGIAVVPAGDINGDGYSDWLFNATGGSPENIFIEYGDPGCDFSEDNFYEDNNEGFGTGLASAGDVNGDGYSDIIVSEPYYGNSQGKVFLYLGSRSGIVMSAAWSALGENDNDKFGMSCSFAGDVNGDGYSDVVIGAKNYGGNTGKAYLYLGSASGLSSVSWTATGFTAGDLFGASVITAGDTDGDGYSDVLVGAAGYSGNTGRAYLFRGGVPGLMESASWTATGEASSNYFSEALAPAGDINGDGYADILAGARGYASNAGRTYMYLGSASGLSASSSWTYTGVGTGYLTGCSVMTAGDVNGDGYSDIIVGARGIDQAYLFNGSASGPNSSAGWSGSGEAAGNDYGWSLASAGDVNGDGYSDAIVGAYGFNSAQGKAYLYMGTASGLSSSASWTAVGEASGNYFGMSVASAGDVNGDGYSDVVIGARNHNSNTGKAYLYPGSSTGLSSSASWTATGESTGSYFGNCVASAGDVNGDGFSDVVVGAYGYATNTGRAYIYLGGVSGLSTSYSWARTGETAGDNYSYSIATAGDVNGDGYSDVIAGAYRFNSEAGKAYLYLGSPSGLSTTSSWSQAGADVSYRFGMCVATAGDVNGDGYSDVVIGANYYNGRMGKAYVFNGSASGLSVSSSWTANGELAGAGFGFNVASAGDVNGDGYSDIAIGSPQYNSNQGKAYLYLGSGSGISGTASWTGVGAGATDRYGYGLASAGDVNGDGYSDLLIGAPYASTSTGASYAYFGNGGAGKTVRLRQYRNDLSAPVAPGGNAYEQAFRAKMLLKSPLGRCFTKLEWQAAPLLRSLDVLVNPPLSSSRWWDSGLSGVTPTETVDISEMEGPWIWRARARYYPAQSPFQTWGRWVTICANGLRETDLRSVAYSAPPDCVPPDEPCWIYLVTTDGTNHTINFQDPNQADQRTGWNIRRSSDASVVPKSSWPLVCTNCVDMDAATANYQWTDSSGETSPSGVWYYLVTTYNENCPVEGPFSSE